MTIRIFGGTPVVKLLKDELRNGEVDGPIANPVAPTPIPLGTSAADVNLMIANASDFEVLKFADGIHSFDDKLVIERDNVSLTSDAAVLDFNISSGNSIELKGDGTSRQFSLPASVDKGSIEVLLPINHFFSEGDHIYLRQPNTQEYLDENNWQNVSLAEVAESPFRESIHLIKSIIGGVAVLATPTPFAYEAGTGSGFIIRLRHGVLIDGITITHNGLGVPDHNNFDNNIPAFTGAAAILARDIASCVIRNVNIINAPSSGVVVESALGCFIDRLNVNGAHNKGGGVGGNGYGLELHEAFGCFATNLTLLNGRHAFIFSAFHAEVRNMIHISDANRDINFHGSPDFDNVIRVDNMELTYGPTKNPSNRTDVSRTVNPGGTNHPLTDFISVNTITFKAAKGSYREDYLRADRGGASLEGGFDADEYILADGRDTIILNVGDRDDTVENFQWGNVGDEVSFVGMQLADITLSENAEGDAVASYSGGSLTFIGVRLIDVDTSNFSFPAS